MKQTQHMSIRAKWDAIKLIIYNRKSAFNYQEWQIIQAYMKFK